MADPANAALFGELSRLGIFQDSPWK